MILRYNDRFLHVWFFDATSDSTLAADFKKLGKAAGIGESVDDVQDFLRRMHGDWLLIFDNADDPEVELSNYIPRCNHGNIIITSRLTEINQITSPGAHFDFLDLEQSEAINLLLKHAHQNVDNNNQQLAADIVDVLGCQALAVATAGAYIASNPTYTLSNYLSRFNQKRKKLLNYKMRSLDDYQKTVFSAFHLSFDQLSSSTKLFMQICAFFHHKVIPVELFYRAAAFTGDDIEPDEEEHPAIEELKQFLSLFTYNGSWEDTIDELSHLSLTMYDTSTKALSFHSIIHMCVQETIMDKDRVYHIAQLLLARATSNGMTDADYQFRRLLIAHADCMHQNNYSTFRIYTCLGRIFLDAGLCIKAKGIWQKALVHCRYYFGKHHPNTLASMSNLAWTYEELGQLEEAERLQTETLKLRREEVLGECHPYTLTSMSNLALTYKEHGQLEEAERLQIETLKLHREVLGEHHPNTLTSMGNLAWTYKELGQLGKAEMLHTETLKLHREVLGECHPYTLTSMGNLVSTYKELRRLEEVEMLKEEMLKLHRKALG
ncbi:TPR-like protein [Armillaria gallica]|uniref:TPR-like protein n=1 Tax=Armillaria gallica TaxID=47427 RepID=A0A2H3DH85_ARMGA|nr:TPR-like protein [Armillaria gallica]